MVGIATEALSSGAGTSASVWQGTQQFVFSVLGALVSGSLVAGTSAYYSEKGRRKLIKEEWPRLLAEARDKSYEEEKGKRLATKEDIDNVVDQVKRVTKATEDTKAEITGRLWEQQWQSTQKRDVYVRLVDALERLEVKRGLLMRSSDASEKADARCTGLEALEDYRRARVMAELLLTSDAVRATRRVVRYVRPIFMGTAESLVAHNNARNAINGARRNIVQIAKVDLNLSETIQSDVTATTPDTLTADSDAVDPS